MKELSDKYRNVGKYKKKSFANTMDKVFLSKIKIAPLWFYALMIGFILNGATNTGMNGENWNGKGIDSHLMTVIGGALIFHAVIGIAWYIFRLLTAKK